MLEEKFGLVGPNRQKVLSSISPLHSPFRTFSHATLCLSRLWRQDWLTQIQGQRILYGWSKRLPERQGKPRRDIWGTPWYSGGRSSCEILGAWELCTWVVRRDKHDSHAAYRMRERITWAIVLSIAKAEGALNLTISNWTTRAVEILFQGIMLVGVFGFSLTSSGQSYHTNVRLTKCKNHNYLPSDTSWSYHMTYLLPQSIPRFL